MNNSEIPWQSACETWRPTTFVCLCLMLKHWCKSLYYGVFNLPYILFLAGLTCDAIDKVGGFATNIVFAGVDDSSVHAFDDLFLGIWQSMHCLLRHLWGACHLDPTLVGDLSGT